MKEIIFNHKEGKPANRVWSQTRATGAKQGHLGQISALKSPKHEELEPDKTLGAYAYWRLCSLELLQTLVRFPDPPYGVGREKEPPRSWEFYFGAT